VIWLLVLLALLQDLLQQLRLLRKALLLPRLQGQLQLQQPLRQLGLAVQLLQEQQPQLEQQHMRAAVRLKMQLLPHQLRLQPRQVENLLLQSARQLQRPVKAQLWHLPLQLR